MGFNQQDAHNLNASQNLFGSIGMLTGDPEEQLTWFPIKQQNYGDKAAEVLGEALMSSMRFDQSMNAWIDVQCDTIPSFVEEAVNRCAGYALRLVVTHKNACSHDPGDPLPSTLYRAIVAASDTRPVWHPVAKKLVDSAHYQD